MDDRHPKRRKDKYNPYTLSLGDGKCYLSFKDVYKRQFPCSVRQAA